MYRRIGKAVAITLGVSCVVLLAWRLWPAGGPPPARDAFTMINGDVLRGRLVDDPLALRTEYGLITLPRSALKTFSRAATDAAAADILTTVYDDRFSGLLERRELTVSVTADRPLAVRKAMIERIDLRQPENIAAAPLGYTVVMRNGDRFQASVDLESLTFETIYGTCRFAMADLARVDFTGDTDVVANARLTADRGRVHGLLQNRSVDLRLRDGQKLSLAPARLQTLVAGQPGVVPAAATPVAVLHAGLQFSDPMRNGGSAPTLVIVPAGSFQLGSPDSESARDADEGRRLATVGRPFAVGKYEVTFAEYDRFARSSGRRLPDDMGWGRAGRPVINVTLDDALAYAEWLSRQTGKRYRLPTEAEWEYAARAATQTAYWWGAEFRPRWAVCNKCGVWEEPKTAPVGLFPANGFGLHDVSGNVWEWTCSRYAESYDGQERVCAAANDDELRAIRGGGYSNNPGGLRLANRDTFSPDDSNNLIGFRVVREL